MVMKRSLVFVALMVALMSCCKKTKDTAVRDDEYHGASERTAESMRIVRDDRDYMLVVDSPSVSLQLVGRHGARDTAVAVISASRLYCVRRDRMQTAENAVASARDSSFSSETVSTRSEMTHTDGLSHGTGRLLVLACVAAGLLWCYRRFVR